MKLIEKHASTIVLGLTYLFAGILITAFIGYYWYVLQFRP